MTSQWGIGEHFGRLDTESVKRESVDADNPSSLEPKLYRHAAASCSYAVCNGTYVFDSDKSLRFGSKTIRA